MSNRADARDARAAARAQRADDAATASADQPPVQPHAEESKESSSDGTRAVDVRELAKVVVATAALGAVLGAAKSWLDGHARSGERDSSTGERAIDPTDGAPRAADESEPRDESRPHEPQDAQGEPRGEEPEASDGDSGHGRADAEEERRSPPRAAGPVARVARRASDALVDLTGHEVDSVGAVERVDGGWKIMVELVELARIPSSTDVLASYEVELDDDCALVGYSRGHRYQRGRADS